MADITYKINDLEMPIKLVIKPIFTLPPSQRTYTTDTDKCKKRIGDDFVPKNPTTYTDQLDIDAVQLALRSAHTIPRTGSVSEW